MISRFCFHVAQNFFQIPLLLLLQFVQRAVPQISVKFDLSLSVHWLLSEAPQLPDCKVNQKEECSDNCSENFDISQWFSANPANQG